MSCISCCFQCLSFCGLRNNLLNKFAFFPPKDISYEFFDKDESKTPHSYKNILLFDDHAPEVDGVNVKGYLFQNSKNNQLSAMHFQYLKDQTKSDQILLFSHGNSTDIGRMYYHFVDLCYTLKVNIFAYEYTGYGLSKNKVPSDHDCLIDIMAAYNFLIQELGFKWINIIIYGQSIGSGPTIFLASNIDYPVGGVVLHSPIASGLRIVNSQMTKTPKLDLFPNVDLIKFVNCPVYVQHGLLDQIVHHSHSQLILKQCKNPWNPWWPKESGHNDIEITQRQEYFERLFNFLKYVKKQSLKDQFELLKANLASVWDSSFNHCYKQHLKQTNYKQNNIIHQENLNQLSRERDYSLDQKSGSKSLSQEKFKQEIEFSSRHNSVQTQNQQSFQKQSGYNQPNNSQIDSQQLQKQSGYNQPNNSHDDS